MALFEGGGMRGRDDELPEARYHLTHQQGKQVQEILRRYIGELEDQQSTLQASPALEDEGKDWLVDEIGQDIDYITDLAKLFD